MTSTVKEVRVSDGALEKKKEVDWFRDSPLRLTGYANEVGEAFRSQMHVRWVWASYGVASAYVLADTAHKASLAYRGSYPTENERTTRVLQSSADTLIWQAFASVIVPGFTINRLCKLTQYSLNRRVASRAMQVVPPSYKWIPTIVGLAAIPFIVWPIDNGVHWVMDRSVRPLLGTAGHEEEHPTQSH